MVSEKPAVVVASLATTSAGATATAAQLMHELSPSCQPICRLAPDAAAAATAAMKALRCRAQQSGASRTTAASHPCCKAWSCCCCCCWAPTGCKCAGLTPGCPFHTSSSDFKPAGDDTGPSPSTAAAAPAIAAAVCVTSTVTVTAQQNRIAAVVPAVAAAAAAAALCLVEVRSRPRRCCCCCCCNDLKCGGEKPCKRNSWLLGCTTTATTAG